MTNIDPRYITTVRQSNSLFIRGKLGKNIMKPGSVFWQNILLVPISTFHLYCSHSLVPSVLTVTCGWSSHHGSIPPGPTYAWTCPALSLKPPAVICHHNLQIPHLWKTKEYSGQNNIMIYASFVRYFPFDMSNFSSWGKPVSGKEILKRKLSILSNHTINDNSRDLTKWQTCLEICKTSHHNPQHTNTNCWVYKALVAESRDLDCCFILPLTSQNHKQSLTLSDFQWLHPQC